MDGVGAGGHVLAVLVLDHLLRGAKSGLKVETEIRSLPNQRGRCQNGARKNTCEVSLTAFERARNAMAAYTVPEIRSSSSDVSFLLLVLSTGSGLQIVDAMLNEAFNIYEAFETFARPRSMIR